MVPPLTHLFIILVSHQCIVDSAYSKLSQEKWIIQPDFHEARKLAGRAFRSQYVPVTEWMLSNVAPEYRTDELYGFALGFSTSRALSSGPVFGHADSEGRLASIVSLSYVDPTLPHGTWLGHWRAKWRLIRVYLRMNFAGSSPKPFNNLFGKVMRDYLHRRTIMSRRSNLLMLKTKLDEPYWFIGILGVDPRYQNQGCGKHLLGTVHDLVDENDVCCLLQCSGHRNRSFYLRSGYTCIASEILADDIVIYLMMRPKRSDRKKKKLPSLCWLPK